VVKKARRRYPEDFKRRAVRTLLAGRRPVTAVALSLGIDQSILHKWKKQLAGEISRPDRGRAAEPDEILSLKREIASVKETVQTLKGVIQKSLKDKYAFPPDW
jgi:transposase-like protein